MESESLCSVGSEEDIVLYCLPCERDDISVPAFGYCTDCHEHLCQTCFTFHKRHSLSRSHSLLDKNKMPLTPHVLTTKGPSQVTTDHIQTCTRHKKEIIKFYCQFHNALLCNVCVTLEHQITTCKVNYIPDISGEIVNSNECLDMLTTIDSMINQCKSMYEVVQKTTALSNASLREVLSEIAKFRKEIDQKLDELETSAEEKTKSIHRANKRKQHEIEKQCADITKSLEERRSCIKHLNTSDQSDKLFIELKEAEKIVERSRSAFQLLTVSDIEEYKFLPNGEIRNLFGQEKSIGKVIQKSINPNIQYPKSQKMLYKGEICVKTPQNKHGCCITGIALINPVYLVISDHDNKSIKMVETLSQSIVDELSLDANPWDVTIVSSSKIAVTIPNTQTIQFAKICSGKLKKINSIMVNGHCQGLSFFQGKLVVTFSEPAKLQILETNGDIQTTVSGQNIFCYPEYVATDMNSIYISDWKLKQVTRLNWQGNVTGVLCDLAEPGGIALTEEGTVFVGDNSKHSIEEISGQCAKIQTVLRDPKCARAICWCKEKNVLYFSSEVAQVNNYLQVYVRS